MNADILPPYLHNTEPLEPEDIPLQLALITMEVAELRERMAAMSRAFSELANLMAPPTWLGSRDG